MFFYIYSVYFKCCFYYDVDIGCLKGFWEDGYSNNIYILYFFDFEGFKLANSVFFSIFFVFFCVVSSSFWFMSLFVFGKFFIGIFLFYKKILGFFGD